MGEMQVYDLCALADALEQDGQHADIVRLVRRAFAAMSVRTDLDRAERALEELEQYEAARPMGITDDVRPGFLAAALLNHALIHYVRATHSQAVSRFNVGTTRGFDPAQRAAHERLVQLRDKAVAHYGPGIFYGGEPWHSDRVVLLMPASGPPQMEFWSRRVSHHVEAMLDFRRVVPEAAVNALQIANEAMREMYQRVGNLYATDPQFARALRAKLVSQSDWLEGTGT